MAGYIGSKASVVSSGAERKKVFNITTSTTVLTGLSYTANQVHVFHNGVRLISGTDYTETNDTTITLTNAAENGDQVVVVSYASFQTSDTVSASAGGTFSNDVTVNGDLTVDTDTLYVDSTNNRVAIGASSPAAALQLNDFATTSVGTTAGDFVEQFRFYGNNGNSTHISQYTVREANGSDWQTSGNRLQTRVDSTYMGWMQFNQNGGEQGISFGTGTDTSSPLNVPERMRIDASGRVTMPYQPAFYAFGSTTDTLLAAGTDVLITFGATPSLNVGNCFNNTNSRFTAPIAGTYIFNACFMVQTNLNGYSYRFIAFYLNGSSTNSEVMMPEPNGGNYASVQVTQMYNLSAGDFVEVKARQVGGSDASVRQGFKFFQGYLIG